MDMVPQFEHPRHRMTRPQRFVALIARIAARLKAEKGRAA